MEYQLVYPLPRTFAQITKAKNLGGLGIGLSGAHRTGKTTMAQIISDSNGFPFVKSSVSEIAQHMGIDFSKPVRLADRLRFQETVMEVFQMAYEKADGGMFVSDRTPLDVAGYLLADAPTELADLALSERLKAFADNAIELTSRYFMTVVVVQPGIPYIAEPGKPIPNPAYQEKHAALVAGLAADERLSSRVIRIPRSMTDSRARADFLASNISADVRRVYAEAEVLPRA